MIFQEPGVVDQLIQLRDLQASPQNRTPSCTCGCTEAVHEQGTTCTKIRISPGSRWPFDSRLKSAYRGGNKHLSVATAIEVFASNPATFPNPATSEAKGKTFLRIWCWKEVGSG